MQPDGIDNYLEACAAHHHHLCPRQVLGVRIGLAGAAGLGLPVPPLDKRQLCFNSSVNDRLRPQFTEIRKTQSKRLLVIVESDGCFVDGVSVVTGCTVGHRTLRVEDYGKIAATFVDVDTEQALRLAPRLDVRQRAWAYAPEESRRYFAQLQAYQVMPDEELLMVEEVRLATPVSALVGRPGVRVNCAACGEEIINQREILIDGVTLCQACAGPAYYSGVGARRDEPSNPLWIPLAVPHDNRSYNRSMTRV
jgi:formylmethanofuran dehydrogenase subunit E